MPIRAPQHRRAPKRAARPQRAPDTRPSRHARGYDSKWSKASKGYLAKHTECVICGMPSQHTDHIVPHNRDWSLFWDSTNWQALCHSCHSKKTVQEMRHANAV